MGLPRYVVNLKDFIRGLELKFKDQEDEELEEELRNQRSKGLTIVFESEEADDDIKNNGEEDIDESEEDTAEDLPPLIESVAWSPTIDIWVTGVRIGMSDEYYDILPYECSWKDDYMDLYIDGNLTFSNVQMKDIYQYKNFRIHTEVLNGQEIEFVYYNVNNDDKKVWFDIDYLSEPQLCEIKVICVDTDDNELQSETMEYCIEEHTFIAPKIDGYIHIDEFYYEIVTIELEDVGGYKEVIFTYIDEDNINEDIDDTDDTDDSENEDEDGGEE